MTDDILTRERFAAGDHIPAWLLDVEPMVTGAVRGDLDFTVPCDVIGTADYYVVVPLTMGEIPMPISTRAQGCRIVAISRETRIALSQAIFPNDMGAQFIEQKRRPEGLLERIRKVFFP